MCLVRETFVPTKDLISAVTKYHADGEFTILSAHIVAEASTADLRYETISVGGMMDQIGRELERYKHAALDDIDYFVKGMTTSLHQLDKDPATAAQKNLAYLSHAVKEDGFFCRFQALAQQVKLLKTLAYAHAHGKKFGIIETSYDDYSNVVKNITGLFDTEKEMALQLIEDLDVGILPPERRVTPER